VDVRFPPEADICQMIKLPLRVPAVSRMGDLPRAPGRGRRVAWHDVRHEGWPASARQWRGQVRKKRKKRKKERAAPFGGPSDAAGRGRGDGAGRGRDVLGSDGSSGGLGPGRASFASFASFAGRVHVHSARRLTAARTGRAQRRDRSFHARRLILLSPLGSIPGKAMRRPLPVAPPFVYNSERHRSMGSHMDEPGTRARGNRRHVPRSRPCLRGTGLRIRIER
jgi:hypothetical protein